MFDPPFFTLDLTGNGELVILFNRLPFFSTTLPILIRPKIGGVMAKPLIMVISSVV
jgi:hypothetical protein